MRQVSALGEVLQPKLLFSNDIPGTCVTQYLAAAKVDGTVVLKMDVNAVNKPWFIQLARDGVVFTMCQRLQIVTSWDSLKSRRGRRNTLSYATHVQLTAKRGKIISALPQLFCLEFKVTRMHHHT
jgi:hypothetical protein